MIHLQGMGLLGSLTAWQLDYLGVEFTWSDSNAPVTAWKACTGACYPSAGEVDLVGHQQWLEWSRSLVYPVGTIEACNYWVDSAHKTLPHGLQAQTLHEAGPLRHVGTSIHCNAQSLVKATRQRFSNQQRDSQPAGSLLVVSHGFSHRRARYLWGWTRLIRLSCAEIFRHGRPSFYLRKNRFQFAYCYPQPGSDWYYAGSSLISQQEPKSLEIEPKYREWKSRFRALSNGLVDIVEEGQYLEGWRPAKAGGLSDEEGAASDGGCKLLEQSGTVYYPVMASNGFRHFPLVWGQLEALLKQKSPGG